MRNFDLSPLYRSAIGFDRLFNHLETTRARATAILLTTLNWLTKTTIALRLLLPVSQRANWRSPRRTICWW